LRRPRCGKTTLAESLGKERILYVNCDLPAVEDMTRDPQLFFRSCTKPVVVFEKSISYATPRDS